jgi:hypothetical protein
MALNWVLSIGLGPFCMQPTLKIGYRIERWAEHHMKHIQGSDQTSDIYEFSDALLQSGSLGDAKPS